MKIRVAVAFVLAFTVAAPAVAGEILVIRKQEALRFTGPFAAETPVVTRSPYDFMDEPCGCVSALYGPCGCVVVTDPGELRRETSVHRSGIGATSTVRANDDSGTGHVGYIYMRR